MNKISQAHLLFRILCVVVQCAHSLIVYSALIKFDLLAVERTVVRYIVCHSALAFFLSIQSRMTDYVVCCVCRYLLAGYGVSVIL